MKTDFVRHKKTLIFIMWLGCIIIKFNITAVADTIIPSSEFEDDNFYQYIMENFDVSGDGLLQQSEAEAVVNIDLPLEDFTNFSSVNIKGIEYFVNLQLLWVACTDLESLEPIRNLTNLQSICVCGDLISDFSPLYELTSLQVLNLRSTKIKDISFLKNMRDLENLDLSDGCNITDFSVLSELTGLTWLRLDGCENFKDITLLKDMK